MDHTRGDRHVTYCEMLGSAGRSRLRRSRHGPQGNPLGDDWAASCRALYPVAIRRRSPICPLAFPSAETGAARTSRPPVVKPEFWGARARMRCSNALGAQPVTFDGAFAGMQWSARR